MDFPCPHSPRRLASFSTFRRCYPTTLPTESHRSEFYRQGSHCTTTRLRGLGITNPAKQAVMQHDISHKVTAPLISLVMEQSKEIPIEALEEQLQAKHEAHQDRHLALADSLHSTLPNTLQKAVEISKESGASTWLTALPIEEHGFVLHKGTFRDALCLRYGWRPPLLPSQCACNKSFSVEHALSFPHGGFPTIRHNEIRDITAHLMSDVCYNVGIEPPLQSVTNETTDLPMLKKGHALTSRRRGFGETVDNVHFFTYGFSTHSHTPIVIFPCQRATEGMNKKKRAYDQQVEHGCFSPLVFSASGGMGPTAKVVYKKLAAMIASKHNQPYSQTINWLRCRLSFSLLRSSIMCLRGSRSSANHPANPQFQEAAIEQALHDGRVTTV